MLFYQFTTGVFECLQLLSQLFGFLFEGIRITFEFGGKARLFTFIKPEFIFDPEFVLGLLCGGDLNRCIRGAVQSKGGRRPEGFAVFSNISLALLDRTGRFEQDGFSLLQVVARPGAPLGALLLLLQIDLVYVVFLPVLRLRLLFFSQKARIGGRTLVFFGFAVLSVDLCRLLEQLLFRFAKRCLERGQFFLQFGVELFGVPQLFFRLH